MRQAEAETRAYLAEVARLKAIQEEEERYQRKIKEAAERAKVCIHSFELPYLPPTHSLSLSLSLTQTNSLS